MLVNSCVKIWQNFYTKLLWRYRLKRSQRHHKDWNSEKFKHFLLRKYLCKCCLPQGTMYSSGIHTQWTYDVIITSLLRQKDVATSFWRNNDVIIASCVCWVWATVCSFLFLILLLLPLLLVLLTLTLNRMCTEIKNHFSLDNAIPSSDSNLVRDLPLWIKMAASRSKCIFVFDALNQLDDGSGTEGG